MGMVNTVGVVLHPGRDCNSAMFELLAWASGRKVTVLAAEDEASRVPGRVEAVTPLDLASRSDLMVSLGGDGTMLRAMRMSCGPKPPVLGVNVGKLGFLAEIDPPEMAEALCAIDEHRFTVEPRSAVRAEFPASRPSRSTTWTWPASPAAGPPSWSSSSWSRIRSCATRRTR